MHNELLISPPLIICCLLFVAIASSAPAAPEPPAQQQAAQQQAEAEPGLPERIEPTDWRLLPRVGDYRRAALHVDPVEAAIARGDWESPSVGDQVTTADGSVAAWRADEGPRGGELAGGYAFATFDSPSAGVMLLEAPGCAAVCLNGDWLPGDPYRVGWFRVPARVDAGSNWIVAHLARPDAKPQLVLPKEPIQLLGDQATLPDLVFGRETTLVASVPVRNATEEPLVDASLAVRWEGGEPQIRPLRQIESRLLTPVTFELPPLPEGLSAGQPVKLVVELIKVAEKAESETDDQAEPDSATTLATTTLEVNVVMSDAVRTDTFISEIDGSVQPYAVKPPTADTPKPGVLLALHDAGESHTACLEGYPALPETAIVAPLGRGRWAFDWEDWSRLDALEALDDYIERQAEAEEPIDPDRLTVIGRGLGGHGALRLATLSPDRFAAVGIIDGWISFYTQGGAVTVPSEASPLERVLARQASANDPLQIIENLAGMGVSVRHTGRDEVAASESRYLRQRLGEFHQDFSYREAEATLVADQPASDDKPLRRQIDWLTAHRRIDRNESSEINFATPDVGAASTVGWASILSADEKGAVARVRLTRDRERGVVTGTTSNVRRLRLSFELWFDDPADAEEESATPRRKRTIQVQLDGDKLRYTPRRSGAAMALVRDEEGTWQQVPDTTDSPVGVRALFKTPERAGGFKSAFGCRPILVYGTGGPSAAQRWAANKARYDAQLFLYRGAGRLEVRPDKSVTIRGRSGLFEPTRSIILYGNAETNTAWPLVDRFRREKPLRLTDGRVQLGPRPEVGDDLAVLAFRPRIGSNDAGLGIVGGTGPVGMRMTTRLRYFWSGVAYPDFLLFGPEALSPTDESPIETDIRAAGYFGIDWGIDDGGILWRDLAI